MGIYFGQSLTGKLLGTGMPAYKGQLTQNDMWKIITYIRAGFPQILKASRNNSPEYGIRKPVSQ
ncbi:hypothetical protein AK965_09245 [Vibrio sp. PID17_43]|nr:hypothetical protein AK965_09245 [Vibrio sp. PID17_43]